MWGGLRRPGGSLPVTCVLAATVLVVTMCSPAGLGGLIGTSVAAGLGFGSQPGSDEHSLRFAQPSPPLTATELASIRDQLNSSEAQMDNMRAADRLVVLLHRAAKQLATMPGMEPLRPELDEGIHSYPVGNYLIFYRETNDGIEVLRILHGARDLRHLPGLE